MMYRERPVNRDHFTAASEIFTNEEFKNIS
jgi:ribonuclease D